jgi:aspartokinase-like uncharacterized kinase
MWIGRANHVDWQGNEKFKMIESRDIKQMLLVLDQIVPKFAQKYRFQAQEYVRKKCKTVKCPEKFFEPFL